MKSYTVAYIHGISRVNAFPKYQDIEYSILDISYRDSLFGPKRIRKSICNWKKCTPFDEWSSNTRYVEDDKVYLKPHADIHYVDGQRRTEYFETQEALTEFMDNLKTLAPHIML